MTAKGRLRVLQALALAQAALSWAEEVLLSAI
jgi:hypothetical protein